MMRVYLQLLAAAAIALFLATTACSDAPSRNPSPTGPTARQAAPKDAAPGQAPQALQSLSPRQASQLIAQSPNLVIVDVRTPRELQQDGMIEGSINLPFWAVLRGQHNLPKDRPLLVVCAVGGRSYAAAQVLVRRQGYRQVYNLSGGISAWKKAGLPVVAPQ